MNQKEIISRLKKILNKSDVESDGLINRKRSSKHDGEVEVLLDHISLLVADLRFNAKVDRRELFQVRAVLEE